jgi:bacterioferritin (cytochrome b1)
MRGEVSHLDIVDKILIDGIMTTNEGLRADLAAERARADRLADRAVMLESRLAEVTRLLGIAVAQGESRGRALALRKALAVAEGES